MKTKVPCCKVSFENENCAPNIDISVVEIETEKDFLEQLYNIINCELVQIVYVNIYNTEYTMYCDEEGKLKKWCETFPLKDSSGNIYDLIANSYILFKEEINQDTFERNIIPMEDGEIEAIKSYMKKAVIEANQEVNRIMRKRR